MTYEDLATKFAYLNDTNQKLIRRAYEFAQKYHQNQRRKTGEPFICHGLKTAAFIADLKLDAEAIAAAILHDICEDTNCDFNKIRKEFGKEIANLVDGVTKLGQIRITKRWFFIKKNENLPEFDRQVETLRKMFMAMARDIRVVIIKLADRRHNMQTLVGIASEKRLRIAKETLEIYAPLSYRLGMGELKGELEDLAFPYVYPAEYQKLKKLVAGRFKAKEQYIEKLRRRLLRKLYEEGIRAEIHGRTKHLYSLWRKLQRYDGDLSRIYDLVALRIIVENIEECYKVLGIIHRLWRPLLGRIKDYIAQPKPNGYSSIHTTVFAQAGEIVEIQIRTRQMHDQAEHGVAAHWHYSEKKGKLDYVLRRASRVPKNELVWIRELVNWQKNLGNREMADRLGIDFFGDRIFVYTPQGDVKDLPGGATPIDFAYAIHTDIGHHLGGAKVNGKLVGLSHPLENGDICEIITKKTARPKSDWLEFTKTTLARSRIRAAIKH